MFWRGEVWDLPGVVERLAWTQALGLLALNLALLPLWVLRSHLVLSRLGYGIPLRGLIPVTILGNVAGTLTPGGIGDAFRGLALHRRYSVEQGAAAAAVLYERIYLPALTLVAVGAAVLAEISATAFLPIIAGIGVAIAAVGGRSYVVLLAPVRGWARRRGARPTEQSASSILGRISEADDLLVQLFGDLRLGILFSGITAGVYTLTAIQVWWVVDALGANLSVAEAWVAYALASYAALLSALPAGLGVWDAALPATLNGYGVDLTIGTATTVILRGLQTLPLGVLAVLSYLAVSGRRQDEDERLPASVKQDAGSDDTNRPDRS